MDRVRKGACQAAGQALLRDSARCRPYPSLRGRGPNPNDLIANETDTLKGFGLFNTTQVRIRRV